MWGVGAHVAQVELHVSMLILRFIGHKLKYK